MHHLDLIAYRSTPGPSPSGLAAVRSTLDGLRERSMEEDWDETRYVLVGTGRAPLTEAERAVLPDAGLFPLFG